MIIGITGRARSGKSTVADILVEDYGFKVYSFAQPLKDLAVKINPLMPDRFGWTMDLAYWVQSRGYEWAKDNVPGVRPFLQHLGEGVREIDRAFWVNALVNQVARDTTTGVPNIVIPDVRYANEAHAILDRHGVVLRIQRNEADAAEATHSSERGFSPDLVTAVIDNNRGLADLRASVAELMGD